jgi:hypothetical protein
MTAVIEDCQVLAPVTVQTAAASPTRAADVERMLILSDIEALIGSAEMGLMDRGPGVR